MSTKLILCIFALAASVVSCNSKTENNKPVTTSNSANAITTVATKAVYADEAICVPDLSNAFVQSITQTFIAAANKVSIITASKGLKVTVDPSALEKEDGSPVNGKITLSIAELTSSDELFKSNAATMSNGQLLASGGSYFVGMQCNGQPLRIKNNASIRMEFPTIKKGEDMELFYGNRSAKGDMNWIKTEQPLQITNVYVSQNNIPFKPPFPEIYDKWGKGKFPLYTSPNAMVGFENKKVTIEEMVSILQQKGIDKNIDSVDVRRSVLVDRSLQGLMSGYEMRNVKRYRVISCKELQVEKDSLDFKTKANERSRQEWYKMTQGNTLAYQLQKYYDPSNITELGWINCDRFYNSPKKEDVPLEMPYTFTNPDIQYFLVYKKFNGLMSGQLTRNEQQQYILPSLPAGEKVILIAFAKNDGQLFQYKEEFVIGANKSVKLNFKTISAEDMSSLFGKNVKI